MNFMESNTYHIYNRSNEVIFKSHDNYIFFLQKINHLIKPYSDILAWCLMPNHFHILLMSNKNGCKHLNEQHRPNVQNLSKNIGSLLSGYTRAFNNQNNRKGKLFTHNTVAKLLNNQQINNYTILQNCFHYIHQNPIRAGLCRNIEDWQYSSVRDFAGLRKGTLVNKELAYEMINFDKNNFLAQSKIIIDERTRKWLY